MTPEERQLIAGLFDRMRGFTLAEKDAEAEALIKQQVGGLPDAPYMLVQSVLVQEHALQQADGRIKALEEQVRALQDAQAAPAPAPAPGAGSFLGGLFGGRAAPEPDRQAGHGASVPAIGARATPSVYGNQPAWAAPQTGAQPPGAQPGAPTAAPQPGGGGFLRSAMTTAAGVAGGMLAANAISSWLGGSGNAGSSTSTSTAAEQAQGTGGGETTTGASQASHSGETQGQDHHEAGYEDDDDDGGWFGGDDFEV